MPIQRLEWEVGAGEGGGGLRVGGCAEGRRGEGDTQEKAPLPTGSEASSLAKWPKLKGRASERRGSAHGKAGNPLSPLEQGAQEMSPGSLSHPP